LTSNGDGFPALSQSNDYYRWIIMSKNSSTLNTALLQQGYDLILQQREAFSSVYYTRLFQLYPQLKTFFVGSNERELQGSLLDTLLSIVALTNHDRKFEMAVRVFGVRHERLGVQPEHYLMVKQVLLETLQHFLGNKWNSQAAAAWEEGFELASSYMI
jgi:hemoglobin-like flavoprotein